jgi:hypothetical protein
MVVYVEGGDAEHQGRVRGSQALSPAAVLIDCFNADPSVA